MALCQRSHSIAVVGAAFSNEPCQNVTRLQVERWLMWHDIETHGMLIGTLAVGSMQLTSSARWVMT